MSGYFHRHKELLESSGRNLQVCLFVFTASVLQHLLFSSVPAATSDFDSLDEKDHEKNNQLAFDVAEREFGISPCMTGKEMSSVVEPDKLSMVMYLSQFYEMFKDTVPPGGESGYYSETAASRLLVTLSQMLRKCSWH